MHANGNPGVREAGKGVRRRQRSVEEKRRIVEETLASESSVTEVARAHGLRANQIFKWRRLYREGLLNVRVANESALLPVHIADSNEVTILRSSDRSARSAGAIQIELANVRVRIEGIADAATVRAVLECLAR
jgi:transposase